MTRLSMRLAVLLLAMGCAGIAQAQSDPMAGYYGNTFVCKGATWECHVWFYPDHTFISFAMNTADGTAKLSAGEGTWSIEGGKLCRKTTGGTSRPCADQLNFGEPNRKVGDQWNTTAGNGLPETLSVVAGHR